MNSEKIINAYLSALENVLKNATAEKRVQILVEIKDRLHSEVTAGLGIETAIKNLGPVDSVCRQYGVEPYIESGMSRFVRLMLVVAASVFLFVAILAGWAFYKFKNIMNDAENSAHYSFKFGDDMAEEDLNQFFFGGNSLGQFLQQHTIGETRDVNAEGIKDLSLDFSNGKIRLATSANPQLSWKCQVRSSETPVVGKLEMGVLSLNFTDYSGVKCDLQIPQNMRVRVLGTNGDAQIVEPEFDVDYRVNNGRVLLRPKTDIAYDYDLKLKNGRVEEFQSPEGVPLQYKVKVHVDNGYIGRDSE